MRCAAVFCSGVDRDRAGVHPDVRPLPQGPPADPRGAGPGSLLAAGRAQAHRRLRLPHLRPLGEERRAAEPGRPLPEHRQGHAARAGGI